VIGDLRGPERGLGKKRNTNIKSARDNLESPAQISLGRRQPHPIIRTQRNSPDIKANMVIMRKI